MVIGDLAEERCEGAQQSSGDQGDVFVPAIRALLDHRHAIDADVDEACAEVRLFLLIDAQVRRHLPLGRVLGRAQAVPVLRVAL